MSERTPTGKAERTRQYIIEQSAPLFNKMGYTGTSLADIVAATNLTKGAIYGNFSNKDALAIAAFNYNLNQLRTPLRQAVDFHDNSIDQLVALANFYRNNYQTVSENGGCPILNTATEVDDTDPELQALVAESIFDWKQYVTGIILEGQKRNEILPNIEGTKYATLFLAMIEGGIMLAKATGSERQLFITLDRINQVIHKELKT